MCCSVLQCAAVLVLVCFKVKVRRLCVAKCRSVLQCVAVCCSMLHCVAIICSALKCILVCCSLLQCVAGCCSVCAGYAASVYGQHVQLCTMYLKNMYIYACVYILIYVCVYT